MDALNFTRESNILKPSKFENFLQLLTSKAANENVISLILEKSMEKLLSQKWNSIFPLIARETRNISRKYETIVHPSHK